MKFTQIRSLVEKRDVLSWTPSKPLWRAPRWRCCVAQDKIQQCASGVLRLRAEIWQCYGRAEAGPPPQSAATLYKRVWRPRSSDLAHPLPPHETPQTTVFKRLWWPWFPVLFPDLCYPGSSCIFSTWGHHCNHFICCSIQNVSPSTFCLTSPHTYLSSRNPCTPTHPLPVVWCFCPPPNCTPVYPYSPASHRSPLTNPSALPVRVHPLNDVLFPSSHSQSVCLVASDYAALRKPGQVDQRREL